MNRDYGLEYQFSLFVLYIHELVMFYPFFFNSKIYVYNSFNLYKINF